MEKEIDSYGIPCGLLDKFTEFAKNPVDVDDFSFFSNLYLIEILKELNLKYFELFFIKYCDLKSIKKFHEIIKNDLEIWEIFETKELNDLIILLNKYQINNELIKNDVINSLAIYLIYSDYYSFLKNERFLKLKKGLEFFNFYKNKQLKDRIAYRAFNSVIKLENLHIKDEKLADIEKVPSIFFDLINYIKFPAKKPINPATNFLIAKITDAGINSGIKKNFVDCTIPLIKELKELYPHYMNEILIKDSDYYSGKTVLGRKLYRENNP